MEIPKYSTPNYAHVDERTPLNPRGINTTEVGGRSSQNSTAADPIIARTPTDSSTHQSLPRFADVKKFFSYSRSADHPYQPIPDEENVIEVTSPLHE